MEKKIISLAEENKISELEQCLSSIDKDELTQLIENRMLKGRGDPAVFISALLRGSSSGDSAGAKRKLIIYQQCITVLEKNELNNKTASDLVGLLRLQADTLTGPALTKLASMFIDLVKSGSIQCGKGLEMLPKILSVLSAEETVVDGDNSMSGAEYKNHVLNSLCSCKWDPRSIIHLAAMFKDVTMTPEELKFVVEKVLRMFKELDLPDLPALIYQLMLLSAKGQKKAVLEGITEYFNEQDRLQREKTPNELSEDVFEGGDSSDTLRYTEGTIILHISFAIKQDQELGREFIKFLKSGQQRNAASVLTSFNCALALSIAHIHRFEDQIYDILKSTILRSFKDCEKQQNSHWVRNIVPDSCDIETNILETVQNSSFGWDHVIQGLVQLGFILMDSFGPKAAFGRTDGPTTVQSGPTHQACQLGSKLLVNTFKAHSMVRTEILDQIFNRVVTKATAPVSHYLDLLSSTVMSSPQILLESTTKVREMFDYLSYLSPTSADGLLKAIQPLLKFSMSLKDALILVLRKAMFNRQLDSRKIGLNGFLMILKHFRILGGLAPSQSSQTFSSSQIQVDIHTSTSQANNEALCLEIMGNLRRALTQQADVRLLFYQGIYEVLCRNTQLQGPVMDILLNQIKRYYESSEDVNPPIKLELCITAQGDQVYLSEPLAHLICCIQLCLIKTIDIQMNNQTKLMMMTTLILVKQN
ncbi:hypothetical protein KUTeg_005450 [Tegillarca granosa]|uniref:Fanconi anemia group I protein n=1 Tax=Tegillarca granosa TaxID=220873 RepID=A0ABQ9FN04_TEGGR|nr:hypothetical protein KUTeg_005450 [Tegillarca granosa]